MLNPNKQIVEAITKRLQITNGHCPCIPKEEWNENTICPCKQYRETEDCHCLLYVKELQGSNYEQM